VYSKKPMMVLLLTVLPLTAIFPVEADDATDENTLHVVETVQKTM